MYLSNLAPFPILWGETAHKWWQGSLSSYQELALWLWSNTMPNCTMNKRMGRMRKVLILPTLRICIKSFQMDMFGTSQKELPDIKVTISATGFRTALSCRVIQLTANNKKARIRTSFAIRAFRCLQPTSCRSTKYPLLLLHAYFVKLLLQLICHCEKI